MAKIALDQEIWLSILVKKKSKAILRFLSKQPLSVARLWIMFCFMALQDLEKQHCHISLQTKWILKFALHQDLQLKKQAIWLQFWQIFQIMTSFLLTKSTGLTEMLRKFCILQWRTMRLTLSLVKVLLQEVCVLICQSLLWLVQPQKQVC